MSEYLGLLRGNTNYRYLWLAGVVSQIGDWFNLIAAASLIADLTESGVAVSGLFLARFLPLFIFTPLAGVVADRFSRRGVMIFSDLLRAATVLGFLLVRRPEDIWLLYTLTVTQFAFSAMFTPARTAVLANIVPAQRLVAANALDSFTWSTMLAVGSLLGGLATSYLGYRVAFVLDAMTFLLAMWCVSRIVLPAGIARVEVKTSGWLDFVDGLRYLRHQPFILALSLVKGGGSLLWGAVNVLEVTVAERLFPVGEAGATTLSWIYAVSGLGTGLGPLFLRRWLGDAPVRMRWAITISFLFLTLGLWGLSVAPTLPLFLLATAVRTIGSGAVWVFSSALLQTIVPDQVRGRVFAFEFAFLTLTQSISIFWAGQAMDRFGLGPQAVMGEMAVLSVFVGILWLVFHLRNLNRPAVALESD